MNIKFNQAICLNVSNIPLPLAGKYFAKVLNNNINAAYAAVSKKTKKRKKQQPCYVSQ